MSINEQARVEKVRQAKKIGDFCEDDYDTIEELLSILDTRQKRIEEMKDIFQYILDYRILTPSVIMRIRKALNEEGK